MPRHVFEFDDDDDDDDEFDDDDDDAPLISPAYFGGHSLPTAMYLGLSTEEAERHQVHALPFLLEPGDAPHSPSELVSWAEQQGVSSVLSKPATELSHWMTMRLSGAWLSQSTVRQCLLGKPAGLPKALQRQLAGELAAAARNHVCYCAHRARLDELRRSSWARAPRPPLDTLGKALLRLHEVIASQPDCRGPAHSTGAGVALADDPPRATASFPEEWGRHGQALVQIGFAGYAQDQLTASCTCQHKPFCRHQRVLLEALLDAIHSDTVLSAELAEVVAVPSWQRLLGAIGKAPQASERAQRERLVWRLGGPANAPVVQPVMQQQTPVAPGLPGASSIGRMPSTTAGTRLQKTERRWMPSRRPSTCGKRAVLPLRRCDFSRRSLTIRGCHRSNHRTRRCG